MPRPQDHLTEIVVVMVIVMVIVMVMVVMTVMAMVVLVLMIIFHGDDELLVALLHKDFEFNQVVFGLLQEI